MASLIEDLPITWFFKNLMNIIVWEKCWSYDQMMDAANCTSLSPLSLWFCTDSMLLCMDSILLPFVHISTYPDIMSRAIFLSCSPMNHKLSALSPFICHFCWRMYCTLIILQLKNLYFMLWKHNSSTHWFKVNNYRFKLFWNYKSSTQKMLISVIISSSVIPVFQLTLIYMVSVVLLLFSEHLLYIKIASLNSSLSCIPCSLSFFCLLKNLLAYVLRFVLMFNFQLEGPVPIFIFHGAMWPTYTLRHWVSILINSYNICGLQLPREPHWSTRLL